MFHVTKRTDDADRGGRVLLTTHLHTQARWAVGRSARPSSVDRRGLIVGLRLKPSLRRADRPLVVEEYFVRWQGDLRANEAGAGARRKAAELRQDPSAAGVPTSTAGQRDPGWSWEKGAAGKEAVARALASLAPTHWRVLHDLPIGHRGANVDHVVLGPPGVFTLNTKHLSGAVAVTRDEVRRNGRATQFIAAATREAERVRAVLEQHTGGPGQVEALLVIYGAALRVTNQPVDVTVLTAGQLTRWLLALPPVLSFEAWQHVCRTATLPATWTSREPRPGQPPVRTRGSGLGHPLAAVRPRSPLRPLDHRRGPRLGGPRHR